MEEKPKQIDDDIEILDFDDDIIIDEPPKVKPEIIEEIIPEPEIIELSEVKQETKPEVIKPIQIEEIKPIEKEEPIKVPEPLEPINKVNNIEPIKNTDLLNKELKIETSKEPEVKPKINDEVITPKEEPIVNRAIVEEPKPEVSQKTSDPIKKEVFVDDKVLDEKPKTNNSGAKKQKGRGRAIFIGILIFAILLGAIIALPFLNDYVNKRQNSSNLNQVENNSNKTTTEEFKSNIDVGKALSSIKDYKNYQYQNINTISTKDNTEQLLTIKNNYIYNFNETKFEVSINKVVADFSYDVKDYYEKLDDVYNLYINDITTKSYNKRTTTEEEFNNLINIFPNMINYLMGNYKVTEEKEIKVGNENHIDITLKVSKDILNYLSIETDRIQNKIDPNVLSEDFVNVDLLFDENEKLYKIEIEIEDQNAYEEPMENNVESAILKYIFTDFNKIQDITLPTV